MRHSLCRAVLSGLLLSPLLALAACPPQAMLCASQMQGAAGYNSGTSMVPAEGADNVVLQYGAFSLERSDAAGRPDLRPTWRLENKMRLSVKVDRHQAELRLKMDW